MRNPQDTKNLLILNKIVEKHFNLVDQSQSLFKYRVLYDPNIAPEYKAIIGDAPDLRKRFKIKTMSLEPLDRGWGIFARSFNTFAREYQVTYEDFSNGKILIGKNSVKLFKATYNFYKTHLSDFKHTLQERISNDFYDEINHKILDFVKNLLGKNDRRESSFAFAFSTIQNELAVNFTYISTKEENTRKLNGVSFSVQHLYGEIYNKLTLPLKDVLGSKEIELFLKQTIKEIFEKIGAYTPPKKDMELVISCNPADMFMASTKEKWTSCINVDSDYEEMFWTGLPGAIVDKNRAIAYITDGVKKNYQGIEIDRFIVRSWLLTTRNKKTRKSYISVVGEYPICVNLDEILSSFIKDFEYVKDIPEGKLIGKYYFEMLFHETQEDYKKFCYIYLDTSGLKIAKKNKGAKFPGLYAYHTSQNSGQHNLGVNLDTGEYDKNIPIFFSQDNTTLTSMIINNTFLKTENDFEDDFEDDEIVVGLNDIAAQVQGPGVF